MSNFKKKKLKVTIVEDEEDLLTLYREYLVSLGHDIVSSYLSANNVMAEFDKKFPDICLIDYRFSGKTNGLDAAVKILEKYPSMPIMFITGYQLLNKEIEKIPILEDKKIQVLVKPVMLREIEKTMLKLTE
ncbi:MAG: response regulator [Nitrososphaeraceae archaeon]